MWLDTPAPPDRGNLVMTDAEALRQFTARPVRQPGILRRRRQRLRHHHSLIYDWRTAGTIAIVQPIHTFSGKPVTPFPHRRRRCPRPDAASAVLPQSATARTIRARNPITEGTREDRVSETSSSRSRSDRTKAGE